jgi:hypothetical protein
VRGTIEHVLTTLVAPLPLSKARVHQPHQECRTVCHRSVDNLPFASCSGIQGRSQHSSN